MSISSDAQRRTRCRERVCRGAAQGARRVGDALRGVCGRAFSRWQATPTRREITPSSTPPMKRDEIVERGRRVLHLEQEALATLEGRIGDEFARAVELMHSCKGRLIVCGVGKSGLIGRKVAAT